MARTLLTTLVLAAALAACSSGAADEAPSSSAEVPSATAEATASDAEVAIDTFAYVPSTVTVPAGTTVMWTNEDATRHTVTAGSEDAPAPDDFDLAVEDRGDVVEFTFEEPGTYAYYCVLHPFMEGVVEVTG